jgi:hypothetical protein
MARISEHNVYTGSSLSLGVFRLWLATAASGRRMIYHYGFLARDRVWLPNGQVWDGSDLSPDAPGWEDYRRVVEVDRMAMAAAEAARAGLVALVQRRRAPMYYEYVAVRTRKGRS